MSSVAPRPGADLLARAWPPAVLATGLVVVWEVAVRVGDVPAFILPAPSQVVSAAVGLAPLLEDHVTTTMTEALLGLVLGVLAGSALALAAAASPWLDRALLPLLTLTQTVPTVVLAPLMVLWGGVGLAPKVVLVALTVFFPVLVAAAGAMRDAEGELGDVLRGLGGTRRQVLLLVRAPAALPGALSGLRLAATYAVGAAVVSEYLAGTSGLGVLIQRARKGYDVDRIFVAVALVALLTALLFVIVDAASRAALPWQRREPGTHLLARRPA
ncbi:ABC-type nitrate/sulfonate/bicarbonate transport system permease component [Flavimobilis soli]|uniref:ABC-type nitrate/sulfonate/bicarbonate transport system permease component n=1 Tax=Flavimobilis soli TaxID=442709 RepID=A0A2A9EC95_9MICO|nr:ABC transporter permease subunit [Flavimobilis soli]PFG35840.1 ABC-type nitrate/sulfonate/bicarbonate transport system permease component [Flavimobilis soli]